MAENVRVMLSEEDVTKRIRELGAEISKDYEGEELVVVGILKGAAFFSTELAKRITVPVNMDFMATGSYGSGTVSTGDVKIKKELDQIIGLTEIKEYVLFYISIIRFL